jgi:cell division protein FtsW
MPRWKTITFLVLFLLGFGLVMVGNASTVAASSDFGNKWYYLRLQTQWAGLGLLAFLFFSKFSHLRLQKLANIFFVITIILLVAVLIPGIGTKLLGARRWLNFGPISLQPAELAKLTLSIYLAKLFKFGSHMTHLLFLLLLTGGLMLLEPDLGTFLIIAGMSVVTFFATGGRIKSLGLLLPAGVLAVCLIIIMSPYRMTRLKTFLNSSHDPLGVSYQVRQALISIGSGGIWGIGIGQSRQKYEFLPEVTTDSIFAIIAEELGLAGTSMILLSFLWLTLLGLQTANQVKDKFSSNLALALSSVIGFQAFLNISSVVSLFPFTGVPLAFISYGGSALVIMMTISGILVNIAKSS